MSSIDQIRSFHDELTAIRRDIHAHPEIGFEEHRTSELVAQKLAEWGIEVHRGIGGTGIVGVLRRGNGQAAIGLRADMDALPMQEANDFAHRSQNPGRMHACGHDGHTTMLLGAARYLATSGDFNGTVHFIFQPAEEGLGGAEAMIKDGLFQRFPCNFVYGMHNRPGLPVGQFAIRPGTMMAGGAFFDITVTGRGSHGARPEGSIDPVLTACHITTALQSIVARNVPPADTAVLSVTRVDGGDAYNVIPQQAMIRGTARTMKRETMELLEAGMKRIAKGVAEGFGATAEVDFRFLFAPLVNNPAETRVIAEAAAEVVGAANVEADGPQVMASEDFSFMLEAVPGAYINIGNGDTVGSCQVHNPSYEFNDEALPFGAAMFAQLVEKKLPRGAM
ncbi:M20 aminoacylase family protein [Limobrevibacterium gyesilva]|uniref:M20 family metallopeptidase n=1 Tax=Limobrevibacterium gyesilva TaxID=2991712 RepID=A0AA41YM68_9PROT|nr:M20 aminoacylase family protein [Limobrevibacterium gyesilva]MCW3475061.1 M20 family metallopeptidase [Limobrevibacterium gyesilva]